MFGEPKAFRACTDWHEHNEDTKCKMDGLRTTRRQRQAEKNTACRGGSTQSHERLREADGIRRGPNVPSPCLRGPSIKFHLPSFPPKTAKAFILKGFNNLRVTCVLESSEHVPDSTVRVLCLLYYCRITGFLGHVFCSRLESNILAADWCFVFFPPDLFIWFSSFLFP